MLAWARATRNVLLLTATAILLATQAWNVYGRHRQGGDFEATLWGPAWRFLHGAAMYGDPSTVLPDATYPASAVLVAVPLAALSFSVATVVVQIGLVACAHAALRVVGCKDWRCHALWLTSCPVVIGVLYGNAAIAVMLVLALLWARRDSPVAAATCLSVAIGVKLFLAPMWLWLLMTRRFRAAAYTLVGTSAVLLIPWLAVPGMLGRYRETLHEAANYYGQFGVGVQPLVRQLHHGPGAAAAIGGAVGVACIVAAWLAPDDLTRFTLVLAAAAVCLTPIAWIFYPALLVVPLAARQPTLNLSWCLVPLFWVSWAYSRLWATPELSILVLLLSAAVSAYVALRVKEQPVRAARLSATASAA